MDDTRVGRAVYRLAEYTALAGGVVLIVVTIVTVVSITGRLLIPIGLSPVSGDYEIVQAGMLFAIFAFLPWCHLTRGHAIVAVLTDRFSTRFNAVAEFVMDVVMLLVAVFIALRLWAGLLDKYGNHESTFILRLPVWMIYSVGMVGAVVFAIIAVYCAVRSGRNALSADPVRPASGAAE